MVPSGEIREGSGLQFLYSQLHGTYHPCLAKEQRVGSHKKKKGYTQHWGKNGTDHTNTSQLGVLGIIKPSL